ncbi:hypothetical protein P0D69_41115 [Paraburkholderia sediminicola]
MGAKLTELRGKPAEDSSMVSLALRLSIFWRIGGIGLALSPAKSEGVRS